MNVRFAHLADIHLGAWRNENLNQIGYQAFEIAIDHIIEEKIDFVIITGDLYDISNPKVDIVDLATKNLKRLKDHNIPVYGIFGSHDFSPSNRSMIRPLISADLFNDVSDAKWTSGRKVQLIFTQDPKTEIKLTGIRARKRGLEIKEYQMLDLSCIENEPGVKIFVFHTMIDELKPKDYAYLESAPKSLFPKKFHYYAGGHLHKTIPEKLRASKEPLKLNPKNNIIYPGCLSPVNFQELDNIRYGGFCIVNGEIDPDDGTGNFEVQYIPIKVKDVMSLEFDCNKKDAKDVYKAIQRKIAKSNFRNKIVLVRISGVLASGKSFEISSNGILQSIKDEGAYEVLINKSALTSMDYGSIEVDTEQSNSEIEDMILQDYSEIEKLEINSSEEMGDKVHDLLDILGTERDEKTKVKDYKGKVERYALDLFNLTDEGGSIL